MKVFIMLEASVFMLFLLCVPSESTIWSNLVASITSTPTRCQREGAALCLNHGTCIDLPGAPDGFYCACADGFDGAYCQLEVDECLDHDCPLGAICIDKVGYYTCECPQGTVGDRCQYTDRCLEDNPCVFGQCETDSSTGSAMCHCVEGHYGPRCEYKLDLCMLKPCQNGGICKAVDNEFQCQCQHGFAGSHCEVCADGFYGPNCVDSPLLVVSECENVTCINGACDSSSGEAKCVCNNGFGGDQCELNLDDCTRNPCLNNGICIDGIADYTCECKPGFAGSHCETLMRHPCLLPNTCHFGTCHPIGTFGAFTCVCPEGVDGQYCDRLIEVPSSGNCDYSRCLKLVNNGVCDAACFRQGCRIDVVDCNPFARCQHPEYCRSVAKNGICDPVCDTEFCLYDGGDCVNSAAESCPASCSPLRSNGICNSECDTEACGFDGSDCLSSSFPESAEVIALRIAENPSSFGMLKLKELISHFSKFVGIPVGLRLKDDSSPAVYVWTPRTGRTAMSFDAIAENLETKSEEAIEVELLMDFRGCNGSKLCRFTNAMEVVGYLKTETIIDIIDETGFAIFDANVPVKDSVNWRLFVYVGFGCLVILVVLIGAAHSFRCKKLFIASKKSPPPMLLHDLLRSPEQLTGLTSELFSLLQNFDKNGQSVLHAAVTATSSKSESAVCNDIRLLLATGLVSVDHRDNDGFTALHWAIKTGGHAACQLLLSEGASPNSSANDGSTPLYLAINREDPKIMLLLLAQPSIDVNAPIDANLTALKHCTHYDDGRIEHMRALLRHPDIDVNSVGDTGHLQCRHQTAVHEAVYWGNARALRLLIRFGAALTMKDHCGRTPLALAIETSKLELAEMLVRNSANGNLNIRDSFGHSPAGLARKKGYNELASSILRLSTRAPSPVESSSMNSSLISTPEASFLNASLPEPMILVRDSTLRDSESFDSDLHLEN